jgi:hypothetical protein
MEVVEVVFIAPNHFLAVAPFLPTADGPPCSSMVEIATVNNNGYINDYYALNASSDARYRSRGRSGRAPQTVREDA